MWWLIGEGAWLLVGFAFGLIFNASSAREERLFGHLEASWWPPDGMFIITMIGPVGPILWAFEVWFDR